MKETITHFTIQIIRLLVGREEEFKPEHRFLNFLCAYTFVNILVTLPTTLYMHLREQFYLNIVIFFLLIFIYYQARIKYRYTYTFISFFVLAFGYICAAWFLSEGISGIAPYYILVVMVAILFLTQGRAKLFLTLFHLLFISALIIIEYHFPDSVIKYNSKLFKYTDLIVNFIAASIYIFAAVYFSKHLYLKEKQNTIEQIETYRKDSQYLRSKLTEKIKDLSLREQEVFKLIIEGKSNKEISDELDICLGTTKIHINSIYKKLSINNRIELINESIGYPKS